MFPGGNTKQLYAYAMYVIWGLESDPHGAKTSTTPFPLTQGSITSQSVDSEHYGMMRACKHCHNTPYPSCTQTPRATLEAANPESAPKALRRLCEPSLPVSGVQQAPKP